VTHDSDHDHDPAEAAGRAIRDAVRDVRAPHPLRAAVAEARLRSGPNAARRRRPFLPVAAGAAAALAAVAIAVVVATGPSGPAAPSLSGAAHAALRPTTASAPPARSDGDLPLAVGDVRFPGSRASGGWRPVGVRDDRIGGRSVRTVTYTRKGHTAAYMIVGGAPLPVPADAQRASYEHLQSAVLRKDGATIVTWRQGGHTCILISRDARRDGLLDFAARS
jgi:hypothetical protein